MRNKTTGSENAKNGGIELAILGQNHDALRPDDLALALLPIHDDLAPFEKLGRDGGREGLACRVEQSRVPVDAHGHGPGFARFLGGRPYRR